MTYEFDGERYTKASTHQREWGSKLIAELELRGDERVPDGFVLGIDGSEGMIETAMGLKTRNVAFQVMDIADLDFQAEFDVLFSNAALHWIKDHQKLLADTVRALKEGGYARYNFAADGNCSHFFRVIKEVMGYEEYAPYFEAFEWPWYMPTLDEYQEMAASAGFPELSLWGEVADRYFADVDTMVRWIDQPSIIPFLGQIPETQQHAFRGTVVARMVEETRQEDATCFETFRRINVLGKV